MVRTGSTATSIAALVLCAIVMMACTEDASSPLAVEVVGETTSLAVIGQPVLWFSDFSATGGESRITRTPNGINYQLSTEGLTPGHAYTLWVVIFNNTDGCLAGTPGVTFCGDTDVVNPEARPDLIFGTGHVVGSSGRATFAGRTSEGDGSRSANGPVGFPAFGLEDADSAEIHLVVHDHGPAIAAYMPDMISAIDGGCTDAGVPFAGAPSPWNDYAGPATGAYGRRGPNSCASIQFAVHPPSAP